MTIKKYIQIKQKIHQTFKRSDLLKYADPIRVFNINLPALFSLFQYIRNVYITYYIHAMAKHNY